MKQLVKVQRQFDNKCEWHWTALIAEFTKKIAILECAVPSLELQVRCMVCERVALNKGIVIEVVTRHKALLLRVVAVAEVRQKAC